MLGTDHHIRAHVSHRVSHDGTAPSEGFRCVEVMSGVRRRRDWSDEEKLSIIAESFSARTSISAVARRHGLNKNQLFQWRRQFREGGFDGEAEAVTFVPVVTELSAPAAVAPGIESSRASSAAPTATSMIEIVIGATTVRVPSTADECALRRVLAAVRDLS